MEKRCSAIQRKYDRYVNDPEFREQYRQKMLTAPLRILTSQEVLDNWTNQAANLNQTIGYDETLHNYYAPPDPDQFHDSSFKRPDPLEVSCIFYFIFFFILTHFFFYLKESLDYGYIRPGDKKDAFLYKSMVDEEDKAARKRDRQIWLANQRQNQSCFADVECEILDNSNRVVEWPEKEHDSIYDNKIDHMEWLEKNQE